MLTLGIDSSTQGTKAVVYDNATGRVVASAAVNYGRDLPEFNSPDGFLPNADARVRRADPRMWVKGLDLVLARLRDSGAPMGEIAAIGGDAQQHATVYLTAQGVETLKTCAPGEVDAACFSRAESPIWMDSSTSAEVAALDAAFGAALQTRTGSPAIERFAAAQAMKFAKEEPEAWSRTARVHLLSSFLTSYLAGADAPIETGDGAGMNLLNLQTLKWDPAICDFAAPGLYAKLPAVYLPNDPDTLRLAPRFAAFGLKPGIPVAPFTGDNPASLVGCGAEEPGCAVISLGTSDVFFGAMRDFKTDPDGFGHVFGNPMGGFMSLSCFKNGSLARERIKRECGVDWTFFDETAFDLTPAGNNGRRAFPYFETEITPKHDATGVEANFDWAAAANETKIRAIVEGQMGNMYDRTRWIGEFEKVYVTGGASKSRGIRGVIADIFKAKVETLDVADSAAVGGARLATRALGLVGLALALVFAPAAEAAWTQVGELQVASSQALQPQVNFLASKMQFPLLPLVVQQAMAGSDTAKKFGPSRPDANFGAKIFAEGTDTVVVTVWPLGAGGFEGWKAAHPKKKIVDGLVAYKAKTPEETAQYAAFSADGKWACLAEKKELALLAAKQAAFATPMKKGLASLVFEEAFFKIGAADAHGLCAQLEAAMKDLAEEPPLPAGFATTTLAPFLSAYLKDLKALRLVLGVSEHGVDLRAKLSPRAGGVLADPSRTLPAAEFAFDGLTTGVDLAFVGVRVAPKGELAKTWPAVADGLLKVLEPDAGKKIRTTDEVFALALPGKEKKEGEALGAAFAKAVPEHKTAKAPMFAGYVYEETESEGGKTGSLPLWFLGWRDGADYRMLARLPYSALTAALNAAMGSLMGGAAE